MENRNEKVKLDDGLPDQVAGGFGYADAVCQYCGENNPDQFYIDSRGPETETLHCNTCGKISYTIGTVNAKGWPFCIDRQKQRDRFIASRSLLFARECRNQPKN